MNEILETDKKKKQLNVHYIPSETLNTENPYE